MSGDWLKMRHDLADDPAVIRVAGKRRRRSIPALLRRYVMERDKRTCVYCGIREGEYTFPGAFRVRMHLDHIVPLTRGGSFDDDENVVCACSRCNMEKSNKLPEEAGMWGDYVQRGLVFTGTSIVLAGGERGV